MWIEDSPGDAKQTVKKTDSGFDKRKALIAEGKQHLLEAKEIMTLEKTNDVEIENILQKSLDIAQTIASADDVTLAQEPNHKIHKSRQHIIDNPGDSLNWLQLSEALIQAMSHDISDETLILVKSSINKTKEGSDVHNLCLISAFIL